jgi:hypothetical protein
MMGIENATRTECVSATTAAEEELRGRPWNRIAFAVEERRPHYFGARPRSSRSQPSPSMTAVAEYEPQTISPPAPASLHDLQRFLLISRGFNWVQEQPFNK